MTAGQSDLLQYNYDGLNRLSNKTFRMQSGLNYNYLVDSFGYLNGSGSNTTTLLSNIN